MHPVMESKAPIAPQTPTMTAEAKRAAYENILGDTASTFTSNNAQPFQPQAGMDVANGTLPAGEVDMSQIAGLMGRNKIMARIIQSKFPIDLHP